jgi:putative flippase GtrA
MIRDFLLKKEFGRFLIVGCLNTAFAYALYFLLNHWLHYQLAYALAYVAGIFFSYGLNTRWVFKTAMNWKSFFAFPLVYVFQYSMNAILLHVLVEMFNLSEWLSPFLVIIVSIPMTFVLSRYVIKPAANR